MATVDIVRDHPPRPQLPLDESVALPASVKRQAAQAESYYKKPDEPPAPTETPPETPPIDAGTSTPPPADPPVEPPAPITPPPPPPAPQPQPLAAQDPVPVPSKGELQSDSWAAKYNSMRGRYEASQRTIGELQEQMSQLGDELVRTQRLIQEPEQRQHAESHLLTPQDQDTYGPEMIDFAQRAAKAAVAGELDAIKRENDAIKQRLGKTAQVGVVQTLDRDVPNWREINATDEWKDWLRKRDLYSGTVRQQLLDVASQAADAPRIVAFFKGFIRDEAVTTGADPAPPPNEQPASTPPPRQAAVPLESLAAPGRARPASGGDSAVPADKPVFTRAQIAAFYANVRRGVFAGRETEKDRQEREIFAAQRDGRIR